MNPLLAQLAHRLLQSHIPTSKAFSPDPKISLPDPKASLSDSKVVQLDVGAPLVSQSEALELARLPHTDTLDLFAVAGLARALYKPQAMFTCGIINARSGRCSENCAFCAQSAHHTAQSPIYPLVNDNTLLRRAEELAQAGATRFGMVTSGGTLSQADFDALCEAAQRIRRSVNIALCGSLGQLTPERALCLREAGFTSYHHNLETAASHFSRICSTHAYEVDLHTVRVAKVAGLRVCSGGIVGLGESPEQRVELALALRHLDVESIPMNFLNPIPGTPLEHQPLLAPEEALRSLALFRLIHPERDILVCGGRQRVLQEWQSWIFAAGANGLMTGHFLTTTGSDFISDNAMLGTLGARLPKALQGACTHE